MVAFLSSQLLWEAEIEGSWVSWAWTKARLFEKQPKTRRAETMD
jgi:hypothetical protein